MKVNSISGIHCHVADLEKTADFYGKIGFRRGKEQPGRITFYVNWFFVTFVAQDQVGDAEPKDEAGPQKGAGLLVYLKVDDLDEFYEGVVKSGMKPAGKPQKGSQGGREFMLRDPDGYKLVFFEKK
jgi:predicted enzyme related to lactoylglutathione lyase